MTSKGSVRAATLLGAWCYGLGLLAMLTAALPFVHLEHQIWLGLPAEIFLVFAGLVILTAGSVACYFASPARLAASYDAEIRESP